MGDINHRTMSSGLSCCWLAAATVDNASALSKVESGKIEMEIVTTENKSHSASSPTILLNPVQIAIFREDSVCMHITVVSYVKQSTQPPLHKSFFL